ncbi:glucocorticoid receptor-like isoform X2 [Chanos chanos]|uniref:Glucocorticoid receptor n=1 Tax=Chanos chanos TaxID=29144 RepID=A0A6J2WZS9_CHACN|nr:glucocorticoid receptor isoform X2 [Chanos chanos]
MDRGLKRSNNQEDSFTFGDHADTVGERGFLSDIGISATSTNGLSVSNAQRELSIPGHNSTGHGPQQADVKVFGKPLRIQHQQKQMDTLGGIPLKENFSLLDASIADLNRANAAMSSGIETPETFTLKTEEFSPLDDKDRPTYCHFGQPEKDERILGDTSLDILQDLDLPGSLTDLNEFYVADETAFLSSLAVDDALLGDSNVMKDNKPAISANNGGILGANVNGTGQQQQQQQMMEPGPSMPVIKTEKDADFIQLSTPGVIKQEGERRSYCQLTGLSSSHGAPMSVGGMGGPSYHYGSNSPSAISMSPDQKPVFGLYPPPPPLDEGWNRGSGFGDSMGMQRASETVSAIPPFSYSGASLRPEAGTSSGSMGSAKPNAPAHKICLVCSDEASGCHYGVLTCGSCKVFFKRAVEGQHNYLCAGRNDCIIDKIRRKNCPACRFQKCLQAGMNLEARKNKKLGRMRGQQVSVETTPPIPENRVCSLVPKTMPQLVPTMLSLLKAIEPEIVYAGYDSTIPDTSTRLLTTLNRLGGRQVISAVKWAKALPGFRNLHLDDQMTLLQCSWLFLMSFSLGWRSYQQCNGGMLCFAPDLVINEDRMKLPYMNEQCKQMLKISNELVRLQVSYEEYLCMKVLLLLSTVPKDGLKSQAVFDEIRMSYIKELGKAIVKREENSSQNWQRFYQLTKLLDSMQEMVEELLNFCFYTFVNKSLSVEFPEMLAEIISNQLPKIKDGTVRPLLFHQK